MQKKTILVTGVAGFIGFHLAVALQERGISVIGVDNFNDYYDVQLKKKRTDILIDLGSTIIHGDICQNDLISDILRTHPITHVVHLAAQAGVRYSLVNPQSYIHSNVDGFLHVLEACKDFPDIPLIYASSSSVYGNNTKIPFSVEDKTESQASLYGVTKKTNELMAYTYHHLYKIPVIGLRFFTVYGPWGRPDMAYFSFTKAIDAGNPIDVYAWDNMQRDFTYIDDIIKGILAAIELKASCEVFNLGNHHPESLKDFITIIEESLGKKAILRHLPMQPGDVTVTYADIEYSKERLNFMPTISLKEGIPKFIKWYKDYYK